MFILCRILVDNFHFITFRHRPSIFLSGITVVPRGVSVPSVSFRSEKAAAVWGCSAGHSQSHRGLSSRKQLSVATGGFG